MGIKSGWDKACAESIGKPEFWSIAVDHLSIARHLDPLIERYVSGCVLDAGAGRLAWRHKLAPHADAYLSMDYTATHSDLDFLGDLRGPLPIPDKSVDTVFCCSVLEHIPEPWLVLSELQRIVRPGGHVIMSVPFLYYLHGAPHDYFRFTKFGISDMATKAGFEIVELQSSGGMAHAILHAISMISAAILWNKNATWLARLPAKLLFTIARAVDTLDRGQLFAQTVSAVLRRPQEGS